MWPIAARRIVAVGLAAAAIHATLFLPSISSENGKIIACVFRHILFHEDATCWKPAESHL
jgi:hypothetical protein